MLTQQFIFVITIRFTRILFYFSLLMSLFMLSRWNLTFESGAHLEIVLTQKITSSYRFTGMIERVHFKKILKVSSNVLFAIIKLSK